MELNADRVRSTIAGLAVLLERLDALVFTAGVGDNSANLRRAACVGLQKFGLRLDSQRNELSAADSDIAATDSPGRILIIRTREDLMIARAARHAASAGEFNQATWVHNEEHSC